METEQRAGLTGFGITLNLVLVVVCGASLIQFGIGMLSNNSELAKSKMFAAFCGYIGLMIMWFMNKEFILGISSILFIVTMILPFLPNRNAILIGFPLFIISSLFFVSILVYSGISRLF